jgi:hypothetical protein
MKLGEIGGHVSLFARLHLNGLALKSGNFVSLNLLYLKTETERAHETLYT